MAERRRYPRLLLRDGWESQLEVLTEVEVVASSPNEISVVTAAPAILGEVLTLELTDVDDAEPIEVRVLDSHPVVVRGQIQQRIRLEVVRGTAQTRGREMRG